MVGRRPEESERPGPPSAAERAFMELVAEEFLALDGETARRSQLGRCLHCGRPMEARAEGRICQDCVDDALLDIARSMSVGEIWSQACAPDGYPTAEREIWGILERRLARKAPADSIADVYPVLNELGLLERIAAATTGVGVVQFEIARLPALGKSYGVVTAAGDDPRLFDLEEGGGGLPLE